MPDVTTRLGLKKPLGNETVSRAAYNENLDILDNSVAKKDDFENPQIQHSTGRSRHLSPADIGRLRQWLESHLTSMAKVFINVMAPSRP
jgi:hypothetical protein